jgi:hypothetical protein
MKNWEALKALQEGKSVRHRRIFTGLPCKNDPSNFDIAISPMDKKHPGLSLELIEHEDDWELFEEPGHDWAWACRQMLAGKSVRRQSWGDNMVGVACRGGVVIFTRGGGSFLLDESRMAATDWVLAEDKP